MESAADVLDLLDVEPLSESMFRGKQPLDGAVRVFGGQAVGQGLSSACRTVTAERLPHSMHAYFLRPGDATVPIEFEVDRIRDGRTFSVRRIVGRQGGIEIFDATASFAADVPGVEYRTTAPMDVPDPGTLVPVEDQLVSYSHEYDGWWVRRRPFDIRYVTPPPRIARDGDAGSRGPTSALWLKARGAIDPSPALARCLMAYVSDLSLLDSATRMTGQTSRGPGVVASLDHSLWFHRTPDFSDWLLYDQRSPSAQSNRALVQGVLYSERGDILCTAAQEGFLDPGR